MARRKSWLIACGSAAMLVAFGGFVVHRYAGGEAQPPATDRGQGQAAHGTWRVRQQEQYALELSSKVTMGQVILQDVQVSGRWQLTVTHTTSSATTFAARLQDANLTTPNPTPEEAADIEKYEEELRNTLYFVSDGAGHVVELRVRPEMSSLPRGLLKSIPTYAQFAGRTASRIEWSTDEADTMGRYRATYACKSPRRCSKTKHEYLELLGGSFAQSGTAKVSVVESRYDHDLAQNGLLLDLQASETLSVETASDLGTIQAVSKISLRRISTSSTVDAPELVALGDAYNRLAAERPYTTEGGTRGADLDRARFGPRRLPDLLAALRTLEDDDQRERSRVYIAMTALFRQMPEQAERALGELRKGDETDFLIAALGDAGTEQAQGVLRTALSETRDRDRRRRIVRALGQGPASEETLAVLVDLFDERGLGGHARLAMGAAARHLERTDPERAAAVADTLTTTLASETSVGLTIDSLRALGNAGAPSALSKVSPYLEHADPSVRAAAAQALRLIPGSKVDEVLLRMALEDESTAVRESALDAIYYRDMSPILVRGATESAKLDVEAVARRAAVRVLAKWRQASPHAQDALKWVALNDPNQKLREVAREALGRGF